LPLGVRYSILYGHSSTAKTGGGVGEDAAKSAPAAGEAADVDGLAGAIAAAAAAWRGLVERLRLTAIVRLTYGRLMAIKTDTRGRGALKQASTRAVDERDGFGVVG
jgi:hypothetical protein